MGKRTYHRYWEIQEAKSMARRKILLFSIIEVAPGEAAPAGSYTRSYLTAADKAATMLTLKKRIQTWMEEYKTLHSWRKTWTNGRATTESMARLVVIGTEEPARNKWGEVAP